MEKEHTVTLASAPNEPADHELRELIADILRAGHLAEVQEIDLAAESFSLPSDNQLPGIPAVFS